MQGKPPTSDWTSMQYFLKYLGQSWAQCNMKYNENSISFFYKNVLKIKTGIYYFLSYSKITDSKNILTLNTKVGQIGYEF